MGTARILWEDPARQFIMASTSGAKQRFADGTNFPVSGILFNGTATSTAYVAFLVPDYASGNPDLELYWYAENATSGDIKMQAALAAVTPETDSGNVETKAFATAQSNTDTQLGTTSKRLQKMVISITNLDSLAAGDWCVIKLDRLPADAADTMSNGMILAIAAFVYTN